MPDVHSNRPDEIEAGAPGGEIEVTPKMIEAGLEALYGFHINDPEDSEMRKAVEAVFGAMIRVSGVYS